ncbi:hypothetical protein RISK_004994 [Rhodopirellula islandica]|uniref:Uncharacterized protein n=1 Tax=Rhodopirellula islandica TaxID=595434 RepID=A0A0J1EBV9_RHOIS|nr:hypothetical protein RISK_004994 [Rhodopirellula islandica]
MRFIRHNQPDRYVLASMHQSAREYSFSSNHSVTHVSNSKAVCWNVTRQLNDGRNPDELRILRCPRVTNGSFRTLLL